MGLFLGISASLFSIEIQQKGIVAMKMFWKKESFYLRVQPHKIGLGQQYDHRFIVLEH